MQGGGQCGLRHLYFAVENLEAAFERARLLGCQELDPEISEMPWGERLFYARDPFGNPVSFVDNRTLFTGGSASSS